MVIFHSYVRLPDGKLQKCYVSLGTKLEGTSLQESIMASQKIQELNGASNGKSTIHEDVPAMLVVEEWTQQP